MGTYKNFDQSFALGSLKNIRDRLIDLSTRNKLLNFAMCQVKPVICIEYNLKDIV